MPKYTVATESRGVLSFETLPDNTYFLEGYQDENDKGKACLFTWDTGGTVLIPIINAETGKQAHISEVQQPII